MRMNGKKLTTLLGTAVLTMDILADCGSSVPEITATGTAALVTEAGTDAGSSATSRDIKDTETTKAENILYADLSGTASMVGSTSMEKLTNALSESFMEKHPNVTMTAEFAGSGAEVKAISNGAADIGNSPGNLKDEEKTDGVAENIITISGITMVVDTANTVEDLTKQQLLDIYEGKVTSQENIGGNDAPIVMVGRESDLDTRNAFGELLELESVCKYSNELDGVNAMTTKVASTPDAIGHVSLDVPDDTVKVVKLGGAKPTEENVKAGPYFLSHSFVMATKGEISEQNDLVKTLFDCIYSEEGAEIAKSVGLIAVSR